jgi:NHL repeat
MFRRLQVTIGFVLLIAAASPRNFSRAALAQNQEQELSRDLSARARIFPEIGPGAAAIKRDASGRYYMLADPATTISVFQAGGKRIGEIPNANSHGAKIVYAQDIDIDSNGRLYVADRGANAIKIFQPDGSLDSAISITAPMSVVALSGGDFAVSGLRSAKLVSIYDAQGKLTRSFGDQPASADSARNSAQLPSRIYGGGFASIYCIFNGLDDLTVRRYDRFGYASYEASVAAADYTVEGKARRWTSLTIDAGGSTVSSRPAIRAVAADPISQDVWAAIGDELVHFDKDGNRRAAYRISTKDGVRLEAAAILIERDRILVAADPLGIFEFPLPERTSPVAAQQ